MELRKQELDVGIVPAHPNETIAFYRDVMHFEALPSVPLGRDLTQHRFRIGKHLVKLNQYASPPEPQSGGIERAVGMRLLAFILDDLEATIERLQAGGHRFDWFPGAESLPYRVGFTRDPEGNVLELVGLARPAGPRLSTRMQIGLTVSDVERSRHFYGSVLGLKEERPMKVGGAVGTRYGFTWGTTTIKFWGLPEAPPLQTGPPEKRAGIRLFTALVRDLDLAHDELAARNVPIRVEPRTLSDVARLLFFADPDDNWIELVQLL